MPKRDIAEQWLSLIQSRRSIRRYRPDPVPPEIIDRLLVAANWAPSAHNKQPWRFAVITNPEKKRDLARTMGTRLRQDLTADGLAKDKIDRDVNRSFGRITAAPLLVLVCLTLDDMDHYSDNRRRQFEMTMAVQSTAMAGQNLLLAAHALGLGGCWMCAPLFCQDAVKQNLQLPSGWQPQSLIAVGYPDEKREKSRVSVTDLTLHFS
ncbi:MAG: nitroreductase family protein [Candidatus Promineifilaceae bacterium]